MIVKTSGTYSNLLILAAVALFALFATGCHARAQKSEASDNRKALADLKSDIEEIDKRLDQLEAKVANLDNALEPKPDEHGILRDAQGRGVGIWGVDIPHPAHTDGFR